MKRNVKENIKKLVRVGAGAFLVLLGIIGLFLPFLQGILLISAGLTMLFGHEQVKEWWEYLKK